MKHRLALALFVLSVAVGASPPGAGTRLHFAANGNFGSSGEYLPGKVGFTLADVSSVTQLNALPAGVSALVWIGRCSGVDRAFLETVRPYVGSEKLFGFYLMDDPDPTSRHFRRCAADGLKAESDWVHAHAPGVKTFIVLMNMASSETPSFVGGYGPASTHIDLYGLDPYPCRTDLRGCDYDMIDRYVAAAESQGIPRERVVPVYQAFGGGDWVDDHGGRYALPSVSQEQAMLARWATLVPKPVFDYAYGWGSQKASTTIEGAPDLWAVFSRWNHAN